MAALGIYCLILALLIGREQVTLVEWGSEASLIGGIVLGFLIGFRNNAAYARWWEGRQLWGQLINQTRNLCLSARAYLGPDAPDLDRFGAVLFGFAVALKGQLRGGVVLSEIPGFEDGSDRPTHVPTYLAGLIHRHLADWYREGKVDGWVLTLLDVPARSLMDICGSCERIRKTPLSPSYRALLRHGLLAYAVLTPVYLVEDLGWWALPVFLVMSYFLIGLELTAEAVEEPFGDQGDDLDLDAYCETIRASVLQILSPVVPD